MLLELFWVRLLGRTVAVLVVLCIFGLPLAWFGLTLFILRQEKHNRVISSQEEMAGLRRVMPCPGCKSDMELGRTRHPFGMVLFQDFTTPPARYSFSRVLPNTLSFRRYRGNRAWKCPHCGILVVNYGYMLED